LVGGQQDQVEERVFAVHHLASTQCPSFSSTPGLTFWAKSPILSEEGTEAFTMPDFAGALGASKAASTLLVLFIPSKDRRDKPIDQEYWVGEALRVLGTLFGGATAFPQGKGVWRDDVQAGKLVLDEPVVIQCYTSDQTLEHQAPAQRDFLHRMGREARQGAVGVVIDRDYLEISFPLEESPPTKRKKRR
jgi:hypothetical protein